MALLTTLPNEVLDEIFSYLPVDSIIATRATCTRFRDFYKTSGAITPVRIRLVKIYLEYSSKRTRPVEPWARYAYHDVPTKKDRDMWRNKNCKISLPEEFKTWLLEFPALAIMRIFRPGLGPIWLSGGFSRNNGSWLVPEDVSTRTFHNWDEDMEVLGKPRGAPRFLHTPSSSLSQEYTADITMLKFGIDTARGFLWVFLNGAGKRNGSVWSERENSLYLEATSWCKWIQLEQGKSRLDIVMETMPSRRVEITRRPRRGVPALPGFPPRWS